MNPEELAAAIAAYAADRKALDIVQLDLREIVSYTDYFVICTGRSDRQVRAIHDAIYQGMKDDHELLADRPLQLAAALWLALFLAGA